AGGSADRVGVAPSPGPAGPGGGPADGPQPGFRGGPPAARAGRAARVVGFGIVLFSVGRGPWWELPLPRAVSGLLRVPGLPRSRPVSPLADNGRLTTDHGPAQRTTDHGQLTTD